MTKQEFPVLIAEDNIVSRRLLEKTLVKTGFEVVSVDNGRKALQLFQKEFFPILLTDWMMPEMDGLELCKAIRKQETQGYVFIILLTSMDSKDDIIAGLESGADDYLTKPFNKAELLARLNTGKRILTLEKKLRTANEEIRILSITDPLTGCYNRAYLSEHLQKEVNRTKRYKHSLALILCDIDFFKKVNDTYGHQAGDEILKGFVSCINESIRKNIDWVARYGGEEFIVVLPETNLENARIVAEKLRKVIAKMVIEKEEKEIKITVSSGVTSLEPETPDEKCLPELMINKADERLYVAKEEGRNRVKIGIL